MSEYLLCQEIINQLNVGYICYQFNNEKKLQLYKSVRVNDIFIKEIKMSEKEIQGKAPSFIFSEIFSCDIDWHAYFNDAITKKKKSTLELYSHRVKKWYCVDISTLKDQDLIISISNISKEKKRVEELNKIVESSTGYLKEEEKINYAEATNTMMQLSGAKAAILNIYDDSKETYKTVAISDDGKMLSKAKEIFGIEFVGKTWAHDERKAAKIKDKTVTRFETLSDLVSGAMSEKAIDMLARLLKLGQAVVVKISKEEEVLGDFTLLMDREEFFNKDEICEIYAKQFGLVLKIKQTERKLVASNQEHQSLIENIPGITYRCLNDAHYTMVMISDEVSSVTGYNQKMLLNNKKITYASLIHPDDLSYVKTKIQEAIEKDQAWSIEYRIIHRNEEIKWVHERGRCKKEINKPAYLDGVILNITKQKKLDKQLEKQNHQQQLLLGSSQILINADSEDLENAVDKALSEVAKISTADRVYVFKHDHKNQVTNNIYEWCSEGTTPQINSLQNIPFSEFEDWLALHRQNKSVVIDDVGALKKSDPVRQILEPQGIKSLLSVPIFFEGVLFGFIGFDSVNHCYRYTQKEQSLLNQFVNNLIMTIKKSEYTKKLKNSEERLQAEKELFKTTLLSVGDGIISTDEKGRVILLNPVAEQLTGWTQKEAKGKPIETVFNIINEHNRQKCLNPVEQVLKTGQIVELDKDTLLIAKDKTERAVDDSAAPIKNKRGKIVGVVLVFRDITEKKKSLDEIEYLSFHDHLTGLSNRRYFEDQCKKIDIKDNHPISLIMGDVNGLKLINDSFGHETGDELLKKSAQVLKRVVGKDNVLARIGGDEMAILLPKTNKSQGEKLVKKIQEAISQEKVKNMQLSISFGIETKSNVHESLAMIIKKAEDDMYRNKLFEGPSVRGKVIDNIVATINNKSPREKAHSERVSHLCVLMGEALGLNEEDLKKVKILGLFHDIGKIAIDDDILNKPSKLSNREYREISRHAEIGYRILNTANGMSEIAKYVLHHHERWDGKGYPKKLKEDEIPMLSRICAIADTYDAITSDRSYRKAKDKNFAINEIRKNAGTQFDPNLVMILSDVIVSKID